MALTRWIAQHPEGYSQVMALTGVIFAVGMFVRGRFH